MKGDVGMSSHEKESRSRCEIGSETTDNLSEDNPVKNAYRASAHALILTHVFMISPA